MTHVIWEVSSQVSPSKRIYDMLGHQRIVKWSQECALQPHAIDLTYAKTRCYACQPMPNERIIHYIVFFGSCNAISKEVEMRNKTFIPIYT